MLCTNRGHPKKILEKESIYKNFKENNFFFRTWMILEEFCSLMNLFIDNDFPVREIPIYFNNSLRLQVDEIESDRHYLMSFPEFLEGFCRVIDRASPIPQGEKNV